MNKEELIVSLIIAGAKNKDVKKMLQKVGSKVVKKLKRKVRRLGVRV